jgi:DNA-binding protein HU-beta
MREGIPKNNMKGGWFLNRSELISEIASKTGQTKKDATETLDAAVNVIMSEIAKGNKVQILGFGTFELRCRKERKGRNPSNGKEIQIPAKNAPAFKPGTEFKKRVV